MQYSRPYQLFSIFFVFMIAGCASNTPTPTSTLEPNSAPAQILFDDFSYSTTDEMTANGWGIRGSAGLPGVQGTSFRMENVSFID